VPAPVGLWPALEAGDTIEVAGGRVESTDRLTFATDTPVFAADTHKKYS
jgi:hypothetical protein